MVGAIADDGLWQALQEEQQGFSYGMTASSFWLIVKEQAMLLPMVRKRLGSEHVPESAVCPARLPAQS